LKIKMKEECALCKEAELSLGEKTDYGARIIYKEGGWFATLSPKTGGKVEKDFCIQLMPSKHLKHISEISENLELARNYGVAFSKLSWAITRIMEEEKRGSENEEGAVRVGTYGKSKHPEEHLHIKIFPWSGAIGQPYTVDSTFGAMEIFKDADEKEFVKMGPVKKKRLSNERVDFLARRFLEILR